VAKWPYRETATADIGEEGAMVMTRQTVLEGLEIGGLAASQSGGRRSTTSRAASTTTPVQRRLRWGCGQARVAARGAHRLVLTAEGIIWQRGEW
jgi:hypothetical protein